MIVGFLNYLDRTANLQLQRDFKQNVRMLRKGEHRTRSIEILVDNCVISEFMSTKIIWIRIILKWCYTFENRRVYNIYIVTLRMKYILNTAFYSNFGLLTFGIKQQLLCFINNSNAILVMSAFYCPCYLQLISMKFVSNISCDWIN